MDVWSAIWGGFARPQLRAFIMVGAICFTPVFIGLPAVQLGIALNLFGTEGSESEAFFCMLLRNFAH